MKPDYAHLQTEKELAKLEKRIAKLYKEARDELEETVKTYFESFEKRDAEMKKLIGTIQNGKEWTEQDYKQWRLNQIGRGKRFEALRNEMARRYTDAREIAFSYINKDMQSVYLHNRKHSIDGVVDMADGMLDGVDFAMIDDRTVGRLLVETPDLMPYYPKEKAVERGIDLAYGKKQITKVVTSGILQGMSTEKIATYLQNEMEIKERYSAIRIARTAITAAENGAAQDADAELAKKGVIIEKYWRCVHDPKTRKEHSDADDGKSIPWDKAFTVGGEKLMFPGDGSMGASGWNIYNCRCVRERKVVGFKSVLSEERRKKANITVIG